MKNPLYDKLHSIESVPVLYSIKNGLVSVIPILLIGSFALAIKGLPFAGYAEFLASLPLVNEVLDFIYNCTFSVLSIHAAVSIALFCTDNCLNRDLKHERSYAPMICALACFFILIGAGKGITDGDSEALEKAFSFLGTTGMFTAIICGAVVPIVFMKISSLFRINIYSFGDSGDTAFKTAMASVFPSLITVLIFALINYFLVTTTHTESFHDLYTLILTSAFRNLAFSLSNHGYHYFTGMIFVFSTTVLWFFGIHGSNVLDSVMSEVFEMGAMPILNRTLIDQFVLIGGCGTSMSLLLAMLVFSKRKSDKKLAAISAFPILFNISEIIVFGLPIIYNLYILIPFLLTPLVSYTVSYLAIYSGIVPPLTNVVSWTSPFIIGGIWATGAVSGGLLQAVITILGTLIYAPFVRLYAEAKDREAFENISALVSIMKRSEKNVIPVKLTDLPSVHGKTANTLVNELQEAMKNKEITLFYQGQFIKNGTCVGAEALMRWNHPRYGMMYPPLVIKLAEETEMLVELEKLVLKTAMSDAEEIYEKTGKLIEVGVNVLPATLSDSSYMKILEDFSKRHFAKKDANICIELTEQTAILLSAKTEALFNRIHELGYKLAIDDFSMGHTSFTYLKDNSFDSVKLDGEIVKGCMTNPRCREIISSIITLSKSLGFSVIAEYVETAQERDLLDKLGCNEYQGWFYAKAVPKTDFINFLQQTK